MNYVFKVEMGKLLYKNTVEIILIGGMIYMCLAYFRFSDFLIWPIFIILPSVVILNLIPLYYLVRNYEANNYGFQAKLSEKKDQLLLTIPNNDKVLKISDATIEEAVLYWSFPSSYGRPPFFPWDSFHYAKLRLTSGEIIYLTSPMIEWSEIPINKNSWQKRRSLFPIIIKQPKK